VLVRAIAGRQGTCLLLFGWALGCAAPRGPASVDGGRLARDAGAAVDALAALDAMADGGASDADVDADSASLDAAVSPADVSGPPGCTGEAECGAGGLCCFDVAAVRAAPQCVTGSKCPSGQAELCGAKGGGKCRTGTCMDYECRVRVPSIELTFFACGVPVLPTVSCGVVFPSEDAGDDAAP
jgi:hypothetical protein